MRRAPARRPLQQGELDGLCGLYAVINAVRLLCPEIDDEVSAELFRRLVKRLEKRGVRPLHALAWGMEMRTLTDVIETACAYQRRTFGIRIKVRQLELGRRASLDKIWAALQGELGEGQVAILGLSGRHEHWTVAYAGSARCLRLADSDDLKVLLRSRCTLKRGRRLHRLTPEEILILARKEVRWRGRK
jgi:hypothetical protein